MLLRIQDIMRDSLALQHAAERFGHFHTRRSHQNRPALRAHLLNLFDDGVVLLTLGLVDDIILVIANHLFVRRNDNHIKFVDVKELTRLGLSSTRHARELFVETEIILERDRCERLHVALNLHALLRFDCLMQAVGVTSTRQETARKLINDLHLSVVRNDVLIVFRIKRIGAQQLVHGMNPVAPLCVQPVQLVFLLLDLLL